MAALGDPNPLAASAAIEAPPRESFYTALRWPPTWTIDPLTEADRALVEEIERAFANDPPLGDGLTLLQAEMVDREQRVMPEVREYDLVTRWQDVSDALVATYGNAYTYLGDSGQRFYLPALMRWDVRYGRHGSAPGVGDAVAASVAGRSSHAPWSDLNSEQRTVVDRWLRDA